jgi:predicted phosphodiesterase
MIFLGDIHGEFATLKYNIKRFGFNNCNIIQVGDFGVGFSTENGDTDQLRYLNEFMVERNIKFYAIRGNHDCPDWFQGNNDHSNLKLIPDYTILELEGHKMLCIGGGLSIDREPRKSQQRKYAADSSKYRECYWPDEIVVFDESKLKTVKNIDIVVTHVAPKYLQPINNHGGMKLVDDFARIDSKLKPDIDSENVVMCQIWDEINKNNNVERYLYGHYHRSFQMNYPGIGKDGQKNIIDVRCLGIDEFYRI